MTRYGADASLIVTRERIMPAQAKKKPYGSDYASDRVFDGKRKLSTTHVTRLRARYKNYTAAAEKPHVTAQKTPNSKS